MRAERSRRSSRGFPHAARIGALLLASSLLAGGGANAQSKDGAADPAPRKLSTADFFRYPLAGEALISPDGKYLGMLIPDERTSRLGFIELATLRPVAAYKMEQNHFVARFNWVNDHQVVWDSAYSYGPLAPAVLTGNLMLASADKSEVREIGTGELFAGRIRGEAGTILIQRDGAIYRLDLASGREKKVAKAPENSREILVDHQGRVRMATGLDQDKSFTALWDEQKHEWKDLRRAPQDDGQISPVIASDDDSDAYVESNVEASTLGFYEMNLATGEKKLMFRDDEVDYDSILPSLDSDLPAGARFCRDYPQYHFFDENGVTAQVYAALRKSFPGEDVRIDSASDDGRLAVVAAASDRDPGGYFLLDRNKGSLVPLFKSRPWIDPGQLSEMTAFVLKARDGLRLRGYLTLPKGAGEKNLPMVVLPHGGPADIADRWGFDPMVQFFAYNGYAVLQVNFRGSGGYGRAFEQMGYRHWGTTMQDDLTDATHWAIQEGIADPQRICMFGASYGGYAALMGAIREPDLYKCVIGVAGPYDLTLQKSDSDTRRTAGGRSYLREALGTDDADLAARSPVYHVGAIKAALLLVHGEEDKRVPFEHFTELTAALREAGKPFETLVKEHEGHGFYSTRNNVELFDRVLSFLQKNIGRSAPAVASTGAVPAGVAH